MRCEVNNSQPGSVGAQDLLQEGSPPTPPNTRQPHRGQLSYVGLLTASVCWALVVCLVSLA